ncbi:MAG: Flp pilus assembly complex ATPase component TadA [Anaerolineae bacterium]|nr:Flp pilus assembly complex ATPase component TadA [Anaerolineae bacterium]
MNAQQVVYLWPFYNAEQNIARQLKRLSAPNQDRLAEFKSVNFEAMFGYLVDKEKLALSEAQKEGVKLALTQPVSVITGGPGTGKTTSMRALIRALQAKQKRIVLAAPTGRAAKRLSETTGVEAKTLHRLLQIKPGGKPLFDGDSPIPADMVIVDETSMLDTLLMNTLLKAVATGCHLLLVGDADQLPSVGAGNVLADLITSGRVPVVKLDTIFRQAATSAIISNAHRINKGEVPETGRRSDGGDIADFFFVRRGRRRQGERPHRGFGDEAHPGALRLCAQRDSGAGPYAQGQVRSGLLNEALQNALNPADAHKPQKAFGNRVFRPGDKVLQLRNNYDLDVFNGDAGGVAQINTEDQFLRVTLEDGRTVDYDFTELDQLALAYAISIHKSQGSEYPAVVIPLVMGHYMMLERKLIYTAVTRAKKLVVLVGSRKALGMAVKNAGMHKSGRFTGLAVRLANSTAAPSA